MSTHVTTPTEAETENPPVKTGGMEDDIEPPPVDETDATSSAVESNAGTDESEDMDDGEQTEPGERGLKESSARSTPPDRLSDRAMTSGH